MRMSADGLALVKEFEGLRLKAYKCPAAVWTIGYGHTSAAGAPIVSADMLISKENAEEILQRDMVQYEDGVRKLVTVGLTQGQFDALVDFAYNAGVGALQKSTLLKKVNAEKFDEVPAEFMKWTKGGGKELPGLVRRRRAEVKLWRGLETEKPVCNDEARAEPDLPVPKKSIMQSKEANGAVIAGGAGAIAVVQEVMPIVKEGGNILSAMSGTALVCLVIMVAAGAIWYFRRQRLLEEGA
jgi:lysozyme